MPTLHFNALSAERSYSSATTLNKTLGSQASAGMNTRLFFFCLFIFQLVLIFQGIELSDEGFLAIFYQQIFKNPESVQYNFMFWLTGIIGGLYYKAFSFLGLWGLRLGGVIVTTSTAILVYTLLKKYLNPNYLKLSLFLIIIGLNNDVKELNYNNLSALCFVAIVYFLFNGLLKDSRGKIFLSGVLVSLNFFLRPPNILGAGLILAIFYYGYENKNSISLIVKQSLSFVAGFVLTTIAALALIYALGHWTYYTNALELLYKMGSANQHTEIKKSDYGLFKLVHQFISNNGKSFVLCLSMFACLLALVSFFGAVKKTVPMFQRFGKALKYLFILAVLIPIYRGGIDHFTIIFFYTGIVLLSVLLIFITPNDLTIRLLMFCGAFILLSYPFGSSAGILTAGRYSFWIGFPIAINYLFNIKGIKNQLVFYRGGISNTLQIMIPENQIRTVRNIILIITIFTGVLHSWFYPFFDRRNRLTMHYGIDNKLLGGIYTTKGRAQVLNELLQASNSYVKPGDYVLAYDCIPLYNFLTGSVPYIKSAYPWLYEPVIFKREIDRAKLEKKVLPVVIMQTIQTIGDGSKWPEETLPEDYSKWEYNIERNKYMNEFLADNNYKEVWTDKYFKILVPQK